jgi:hypothetical protein
MIFEKQGNFLKARGGKKRCIRLESISKIRLIFQFEEFAA